MSQELPQCEPRLLIESSFQAETYRSIMVQVFCYEYDEDIKYSIHIIKYIYKLQREKKRFQICPLLLLS